MSDGMTLDELKQVNIDYYVNLMRIKEAQNGSNKELDYQIKVAKAKLQSLGIQAGGISL